MNLKRITLTELEIDNNTYFSDELMDIYYNNDYRLYRDTSGLLYYSINYENPIMTTPLDIAIMLATYSGYENDRLYQIIDNDGNTYFTISCNIESAEASYLYYMEKNPSNIKSFDSHTID